MNDTLAALVIAHHVVLLRLLDQMDPKARQRVHEGLTLISASAKAKKDQKTSMEEEIIEQFDALIKIIEGLTK